LNHTNSTGNVCDKLIMKNEEEQVACSCSKINWTQVSH